MDLIGQRWVLRILWELEPGRIGFLELRRRMGNCSSSMLSERLRQLHESGIVKKNAARTYELTSAGTALNRALDPLWAWSRTWPPGKRSAADRAAGAPHTDIEGQAPRG
ncbi:helix-turn-helix transcriptional regulator [Rhodococcus fascians]|nr:helix-turn-helix transcriptional regulator [Rhodococcus fascians]MBY4114653.1 helix-turn-helix transcriptional regulator [Rhodococcus fascians]